MSFIQIKKHSGVYSVRTHQELPLSLHEAWDFFTQSSNLQKITPPNMGFEITGSRVEKTYLGQMITYKIGLLLFVKTNWVTEITHFQEEKLFVDEQRFGPYAMWHHEHHFEQLPNGNSLMKDIIHYKLPFGELGNFLMGAIIRRQVKAIFDYRSMKIEELFSFPFRA